MSEQDIHDAQAVLRMRGDLVSAEARADFSHAEAASATREAGEWKRAARHVQQELEEIKRLVGHRAANRALEIDRAHHRSPGSAHMENQRACYRAAVGELEAVAAKIDNLAAMRSPEVARTLAQYAGVGRVEDREG